MKEILHAIKIQYTVAVIGILLVFIPTLTTAKTNTNVPYNRIVISSENIPVKNAIVDLQRYIAQVTGKTPVVSRLDKQTISSSAIIIANYSQLKGFFSKDVPAADIGDEGYVIKQIDKQGNRIILLYANTNAGLVNGIYGLLSELGFEFNLGSEVVPASLPNDLTVNPIIKKPVFSIRGVLPWYNFFNSPTAWDAADHRAFVDQLIRSGANFITFHSYDNEPFSAVKENGKMILGGHLRNTGLSTWGTNPMATADFKYGTDKLYDTKYFGAATTLQNYDESTEIEKEKAVLKEALLYAKSRGLKTSIGFAPYGDPTLKKDRDQFIKQFTYNLEYYNFVDYLFIWQTETKGAQGYPLHYDTHILPDKRDPNSKIINYGVYRAPVFKRIVDKESGIKPFFKPDSAGKIARATEGARLELFAKLALKILSRYKNAPKLVISGWGGENYLLSEEYYDGLDKVLPKDVAFSSLESLTPKPTVDKVYAALPPDRQRWPIPWLENDGDQWHPQTYLKTFEPLARDILKSGSQGFLTIHWRTREVEDNFGYLLSFSWDTTLTRASFFAKKAQKYKGVSDELKQIYLELDDLGYRWVGGKGQNECAIFTWGSGSPAKLEKLKNIKERLVAILPKVRQEKDNLIWLNDRMEYVINYQNAEVKAEEARDLLENAKKSSSPRKETLAKQALAILSGDELAVAMHSYAKEITTRGEYGVLATMNTKAAYDWERMYKEASAILNIKPALLSQAWDAETRIIVPGLYGSCTIGKDFELKAIVLGGKPAQLKYHTLGNKTWKDAKVQTLNGSWVQSFVIPASDVAEPGIVYSISVAGESQYKYGPKAITVIPAPQEKDVLVKKAAANQQITNLEVTEQKGIQVINWTGLSDADFYRVYYDKVLQVETPVNFYPDKNTISHGQHITVVAVKGDVVISTFDKLYE
ncbi:MAG TPA: alpha-glucuronidase family glycosyl hydrolase [Mucilaginibacter sp.]|jgi:hypothetical protein